MGLQNEFIVVVPFPIVKPSFSHCHHDAKHEIICFPIGKQHIWRSHLEAIHDDNAKMSTWGPNRSLFRGLGLKSDTVLGLRLDVAKTLFFI